MKVRCMEFLGVVVLSKVGKVLKHCLFWYSLSCHDGGPALVEEEQ